MSSLHQSLPKGYFFVVFNMFSWHVDVAYKKSSCQPHHTPPPLSGILWEISKCAIITHLIKLFLDLMSLSCHWSFCCCSQWNISSKCIKVTVYASFLYSFQSILYGFCSQYSIEATLVKMIMTVMWLSPVTITTSCSLYTLVSFDEIGPGQPLVVSFSRSSFFYLFDYWFNVPPFPLSFFF